MMGLVSFYIIWLMVFIIGFVVCFVSLPFLMSWMKKLGIEGKDVHKRKKPSVPEMGGVSILFGLAASVTTALVLLNHHALDMLAFLFTVILAGLIGAWDDLHPLSAKVKPILTMLAGLPILFLGSYDSNLILPIIGQMRLNIVYPLMVPLIIGISSNAVNMADPFNGTMSGSCAIIAFVLLIAAIVTGGIDSSASVLAATLLSVLLAFYHYNKYPSRVFSGDVGSLSIGAALGAITIIGRLEIIAVVAFMPQIMNAVYGLSTMGRLFERREVSRPIKILDDGRLVANDDPKAPITLARLILAKGPLHEFEAIRIFLILSAISGCLALVTLYLSVIIL